MSEAPQGRVTLVPTPIGNLGDITLRAMETLTAADVICAEDTRRTGILLQHLGIKKPMLSFHEHNEAQRTAEITQRVAEGTHVAVVTDAGMPSISDPGLRLVRACREKDIPIDILPGPFLRTYGIGRFGVFNGRLLFWRVPAGQIRGTRPRTGSRSRTLLHDHFF